MQRLNQIHWCETKDSCIRAYRVSDNVLGEHAAHNHQPLEFGKDDLGALDDKLPARSVTLMTNLLEIPGVDRIAVLHYQIHVRVEKISTWWSDADVHLSVLSKIHKHLYGSASNVLIEKTERWTDYSLTQ